jgi:hypothetical protein
VNLALKVAATFVAAALPIALATPAFAVDYDRLNITVDCGLGEIGEDDHVLAPGEVLTVTFANCSGYTIEDEDNTGNATMPDNTVIVSGNTQTISSNSFVVTVDGEADLDVDDSEPDVDVYVAGPTDDPSSTLLTTEDITIELSASETMIREEAIGTPGDDGEGDIYIDGKEECQVEPGLHVYETLEFEVTKEGTYDFRAVAVSPIDEDLNWGVDKFPSSDPFLAVYETFNPALPETGVVGCNDDGDDTGVPAIDGAWAIDDSNSFEGLLTESGDIVDDQWPWFRATLEKGNYTLVYMPFSTAGTEDFAAGRFASSSGSTTTWDPIAQTVTYEMWGPAGGIDVGGGPAPEAPELAETGVEPTLALWSALFMIGTGAVIMAVRRRREQRA